MEANEDAAEVHLDDALLIEESEILGLGTSVLTASHLSHNPLNRVTGSLHRVDWDGGSAVRKHVTQHGDGAEHWVPSDDPQHWNYWRREVEIYKSGLPDRLGLDAPGLIGTIDQDDGSIVLWLEWVDGTSGADCGLHGLIEVSGAVGRSQGKVDLLDDPFLSRNFIADYGGSKPVNYGLLDDDEAWAHPYIANNWSPTIRPAFLQMCRERERWLDILASLPRTTAHLDLWPNNMVCRSGGGVALLDWAFTGDGVRGEDIGNLIPDGVIDLLVPSDRMDELEQSSFNAYVAGLRESGWTGDETEVRLGMVASAIKYVWLVPLLLERVHEKEHRAYGQLADPHKIYADRGVAIAKLAAWSQEALTLAGSA